MNSLNPGKRRSSQDRPKVSAAIPPKIFESLFVAFRFTRTYAWHLIAAQLTVRLGAVVREAECRELMAGA
jgi:hypothetical protein